MLLLCSVQLKAQCGDPLGRSHYQFKQIGHNWRGELVGSEPKEHNMQLPWVRRYVGTEVHQGPENWED